MKNNTFDIARMEALKEYANLEYELCLLLKAVLRVEAPIASAIFYQIASTRSRYAIIGSVLEINHEATFHRPWPKLERWLTPLDTARNHIVHWGQDIQIVVLPEQEGDNPPPGTTGFAATRIVRMDHSLHLSNRARMWRQKQTDKLAYTEEELRECKRRFLTMANIINRFNTSVFFPDREPWTHIFQQPITDQTPEAFLSRLNDAGEPVLR